MKKKAMSVGAIIMMSVYYPSCDTLPDPTCSDCPEKELGRVRGMALVNKNYTFLDPTNPAEWDAAIQARSVYLFPYTKGTLAMNEVLTQGFGNVEEDLDAYEYVLGLMEPNFKANRNFWNSAKKSHQYITYWVTETILYVPSVPATIIPKFKTDDDLKSKVVWDLGFKFVQEDIVTMYNKPTGVFDRCIIPS